ncbi:hypothetical protein [Bradyrhizobium iriomotense]|uniref:Rap1a immunity protein domain-containing protein n=1 Tax=Bradyrhizobium iriomotense TaxID=441950 RepID=A0ABQ6B0P4_9BRAD|nr:hypothetical protein [Bradyrhizobium iriomotense]GLR87989.1 hypothetical protein GCM10007857_47010 [Bradyrhizobium iriomotense]
MPPIHRLARMLPSVAALAGVLVISFSPARAEKDAAFFIAMYARSPTDRAWIEDYLGANYNGLSWANADLQSKNLPPLFCQPVQFVPTNNQLYDIVKRQSEADQEIKTLPFGAALLRSLQKVFPCV